MKIYALHCGLIVEINAAHCRPISHGFIEAHGWFLKLDEGWFYSEADALRKLARARTRQRLPGRSLLH